MAAGKKTLAKRVGDSGDSPTHKSASDSKATPSAVAGGRLRMHLLDELRSVIDIAEKWAHQLLLERKRDGRKPGKEDEWCRSSIALCVAARVDLDKFERGAVRVLRKVGPDAGNFLLFEITLPDIRFRAARAQTLLNQAMFPEFREGRKKGSKSAPAYLGYVATALRQLDGNGPMLKQLHRWLEGQSIAEMADRLIVNGIRLESIDSAQPPRYKFEVFESGKGKGSRSYVITRRRLEAFLALATKDRRDQTKRDAEWPKIVADWENARKPS